MTFKKAIKTTFIILISILLCFCNTVAQVLDNSFGTNGIVVMPFDQNGGGSIESIAQQSDEKIIALGGDYRIIRYHINGVVDSSFASNGRSVKPFNGYFGGSANKILIQPDGKIIVSGSVWGGSKDFAIARFNQYGMPDLSFNGTGDAVIDINGHDDCNGIALQPDGKIILGGDKSSGAAVVVIRLNPDGTVDSSFNNNQGIFTAPFGVWSSNLNAITVKSDGKILACGDVNNGGGIDFLLLQLLPDGQLDSAFGINGVVITPNTGFGHDFALQQDGKIVIVGRDVATGGHMVRYLPDGSIDGSFGTNGHVFISHPSGRIPGPEQIEIDNNGKIYAAGHISINGTMEDMFLIRVNSDGTIDNDYAPEGIITQVSTSQERTYSMLIQKDGRILTAGYANVGGSSNLCMLRFWPYRLSVKSVLTESNTVRISPNPAIDRLDINIESNQVPTESYSYEILNTTGQVIHTKSITSKTIDISNIPAGAYILHIYGNRDNGGLNTYTRFCKL